MVKHTEKTCKSKGNGVTKQERHPGRMLSEPTECPLGNGELLLSGILWEKEGFPSQSPNGLFGLVF